MCTCCHNFSSCMRSSPIPQLINSFFKPEGMRKCGLLCLLRWPIFDISESRAFSAASENGSILLRSQWSSKCKRATAQETCESLTMVVRDANHVKQAQSGRLIGREGSRYQSTRPTHRRHQRGKVQVVANSNGLVPICRVLCRYRCVSKPLHSCSHSRWHHSPVPHQLLVRCRHGEERFITIDSAATARPEG